MPLFKNQLWPPDRQRPLLFIDLEMTGLDPQKHEIIEVAALAVEPTTLEITSSYYTKVFPTHLDTANPDSLQLVNYSPSAWSGAISLHQMLLDLSQLAPACFLAGWSVQNEWDFLLAALDREHLPYFFDNHLVEVWSLVYAHFFPNPEISRFSMVEVSNYFNISLERHKPDSDIRATYEIYKQLIAHT